MIDKYKELIKIADKNCSCTPKQQTGEDPTWCISCMASSTVNYICEIVRNEYKEVMDVINNNQKS
tara:strand:+ start:2246 stop:2440 length:195 start_codon:yes stop_codon:yes gene_type:complete